MPKVVYYQTSKTEWIKCTYPDKCGESIFLDDECQGVKGHDGDHWSYMPSGKFLRSHPKGGCCITPPGHSEYVSPVDKAKDYYMEFWTKETITDHELLRKLASEEEVDGDVDRIEENPFEFLDGVDVNLDEEP